MQPTNIRVDILYESSTYDQFKTSKSKHYVNEQKQLKNFQYIIKDDEE